MQQKHVINIEPSGVIQCVNVLKQGQLRQSQFSSLSQVKNTLDSHEVVVLIPSESVSLYALKTPVKGRNELKKSIPLSLEEQVIDDIDDLHFAFDSPLANNKVPVAVIAHKKMQPWVDIVEELGLNSAYCIPELFLLPYIPNAWNIVVLEHKVLIRTGEVSGLSVRFDDLMHTLTLLLEIEEKEQVSIYISGTRDALTQLPLKGDKRFKLAIKIHDGQLIDLVKQAPNGHLGINLMQGKYLKEDPTEQLVRQWITPLILVALILLISVIQTSFDAHRLTTQRDTISQDMVDLYRTTFPDANKVQQPKKQMQQRLLQIQVTNQTGYDGVWLIFEALSKTLGSEKKWELTNLRYKNNQVEINMQIATMEVLERIKSTLSKQHGLNVSVSSVSPEKTFVSARLKITIKKKGA